MLISFEVTNTHNPLAKFRAVSQFLSFCYGELRDTYLKKLSPFYHSNYENLVLRGKLASGGAGSGISFSSPASMTRTFPGETKRFSGMWA